MKRKLFTVIAAVLLISGLMMLIAPRISNRIGEQIAHSTIDDFKALKSKATSDEPTEKKESSEDSSANTKPKKNNAQNEYASIVQNNDRTIFEEEYLSMPENSTVDFDLLYSDSIAYNENLKKHQHELLTNEQSYQSPALNLSSYGITNGVYGYISAPSIGMELPIYLGGNDFNMASGAAHMTCTSLPVGGNSTNCVLSGHAGYIGRIFFDYIPNLSIGDEITVENYWNTLTYKYVAQEPQTVTVEYGKTATVTFKNVLKKSEITIVKKDAESKKTIPLAGFGFRIQKADGSYVAVDQKDVFFTDSTGTIKLPVKLAFGSYKLIEVQAGTGYVLDGTPISFTVDGTKTVIELVKYNNVEKGTITITKTGDIFASVTEEEVTEPTTEPSATEETTAPAEESTTTPETTTIPAEESTAPTEPSETDDRKPVIKYQPVYKNGGLADAEFTITAAEDITTPDGTVHFKKGEVVDTITTGKDGTAKTKALYLGKYTITETKNPFGYVANPETYTVEIKYAGQNVEVTNTDLKVENIRQKTEITLQKVLEKYDLLGIGDNGEIANVAFALFADEDITAADGKVIPKDGLIEIIHCDENGKVRFNTEIPFGKYYVQEYSTDKHYIIDSTKYTFEFAYTPDTDVQHFDITSEKELVNALKRGTVYTTKVDEEYPENKLSGAVFEIYADVDGDKQFDPEVDKLVGEMKEVPVKPGDYYFTDLPVGGFFLCEKEAPAGFEKDDNYYYFEITEDGDEVTVENKAGVGFVNKPTTGELEITKKDVATGKPLPKAGFRIKDADGKVVAEGYTDENGVARFKLRAGKYTYEEFDAPEGYIIDTTPHEFEITEDGQIVKAEMTNEKESTPDTPQTGDSSMTGFFIGLGALALGGLVACVILFLKKKKDDGDDE